MSWRPNKLPDEHFRTSRNGQFGLDAEVVIYEILDEALDRLQETSEGCVELYTFCDAFPDETPGSKEYSIRNNNEGDLFLVGDVIKVGIEVKSSETYQNVTITTSELLSSRARYIMAYTPNAPVKFWITTMKSARAKAFDKGDYWIVPYRNVKKLTIEDVLKETVARDQ